MVQEENYLAYFEMLGVKIACLSSIPVAIIVKIIVMYPAYICFIMDHAWYHV